MIVNLNDKKMSKNSNLHKAKKEKNDEFYTLLSDIEKEMKYYKDYFKDKVVYCNCDDAKESNFFKYFSENFELLGLKKLITTGYKEGGHGVVLVYEGDKNGDFMVSDDEISTQPLAGDGDFRSPECIEFLKQADVVVTNPPFSLFREYIAQLMAFGKKFIILGNAAAAVYEEIYTLMKDNRLWYGVSPRSMKFAKPDKTLVDVNACWFTNLVHKKRNTKLDLCKKYNSTDYPKLDNYNAINVSRTENIPEDYFECMAVPITFLDKYCPDQFEIVGIAQGSEEVAGPYYLGVISTINYDGGKARPYLNGKSMYARILIKRKI